MSSPPPNAREMPARADRERDARHDAAGDAETRNSPCAEGRPQRRVWHVVEQRAQFVLVPLSAALLAVAAGRPPPVVLGVAAATWSATALNLATRHHGPRTTPWPPPGRA
jgi:hypothetical protein